MSKPIKLLLSLEAVKALHYAVAFVLDDPQGGFLEHDRVEVLKDAAEVLQSAITGGDEDALIDSVRGGK